MFLVIDITPTPQPTTEGFDICRDSPWIVGAATILFFGISLVYAIMGGGQWNLNKFQFYLFHIIAVPVAVFATLWCYAHPEQIESNPDGWMSDLRPIWPIFAVIDLCLIAKFMSGRKTRRIAEYQEQAARYMRVANECLAEGKDAEAEYAYQKGKWILENKCKGG